MKISTLEVPQGVLPDKEVRGGLDLTSSLEAKFGARSSQFHQIREKIWEVLSPQDAKFEKSPSFGVISEIQRAKFGVFVTYIFGGKIWGSNKNFRGKFWGQAPRPPDMEVAPLGEVLHREMNFRQLVSLSNKTSIACFQGCPEFPRRELLSLR